jgi:hypothetical protein
MSAARRKPPMTEALDMLADLMVREYNKGETKGHILSDLRDEGILTQKQERYVRLRTFIYTRQS